MADNNRANFGSKLGVVAAAAGSAVGLGNIWRFPYELGQSGGGAFLLIYIVCIVLLGLPIMTSEFLIGRMSQSNAVGAFRKLGPKGSKWWLVGVMGVLSAFFIMGFYVVVSGWTLEYIVQAVTNSFANKDTETLTRAFTDFSTGTWRPIIWMTLFLVITCVIIVGGVKNGIEKSAKFMMPLLLIIIVALGVRAVTLPGGAEGLRFLFKPDFSKIDSSVVLNAMGQAFFSLSLGMGCMITYGSYINKKNHLAHTVLEVTFVDTIIAVLASIAIFPAVFSFGINPEQGPTLVFITLPNIFAHMPGGLIWSLLFFILLSIAALTSTISLLEVIVAFFTEEFKMSRAKAAIIASAGIWVLGVCASLSMGVWSDVHIFGFTIFDFLDNITSKIMMPLGGLLIALFAGWVMKKDQMLGELSNNGKYKTAYFRAYYFIVRFVAPVAILMIFLNQLGVFRWLRL
ncbi:sodium-dependent transporter [Paludibacter sp. 221]|uniref:sodium-dependent transporter n=1 Tax=Paludibacter sp. 221 TaxID=2302939 RepID=UPI0013D63789|nr:sodium-dependent transporter [Paludibacter sp. 221]NDV45925.1 sodium-dependent transporter [Paludibacter sp. 221]